MASVAAPKHPKLAGTTVATQRGFWYCLAAKFKVDHYFIATHDP
jgi:hypothetical protein